MSLKPPDPVLAKVTVLPELFDLIRDDSISVEEMFRRYEKIVAARMITIALTEDNANKMTSVSKDILDRVQGKAVEKKDSKHRLEKVSDKELDAVLLAKLKKIRPE
jgi:ABC-type branched-subunit amino acid transport system ATPase component